MLNSIIKLINTLFSQPSVPEQHKRNFLLLTLDYAGIGVVNGSVLAFLAVYASRIGATSAQIGLITAIPALICLLIALPVAQWIAKKSLKKSVVISAIAYRFYYLILVFVPFIGLPLHQIWFVIAVTFAVSMPGTILSIGFNAFFAETVPPEWRAHVSGSRSAAFSVTNIVFTILCGVLLESIRFPIGYQIVFGIGFLGALSSTVILSLVKLDEQSGKDVITEQDISISERSDISKEKHSTQTSSFNLRFDILRSSYLKYLILMFIFHLFVFIPSPVFPLFMVNELYLNDFIISVGMAVFYIAVLLGSLRLSSLTRKWGNKKVMGIGSAAMSTYPLFLAIKAGILPFIAASFFGGLAWALAGGTMYNYILEKIPTGDRPSYLAWYNMIYNAALLIASLSGGLIGNSIGLAAAIILFGIGRILAGLFILRWG